MSLNCVNICMTCENCYILCYLEHSNFKIIYYMKSWNNLFYLCMVRVLFCMTVLKHMHVPIGCVHVRVKLVLLGLSFKIIIVVLVYQLCLPPILLIRQLCSLASYASSLVCLPDSATIYHFAQPVYIYVECFLLKRCNTCIFFC